MKCSVNELISNCGWMQCTTGSILGEHSFKIRIRSFDKVRKEDIFKIHNNTPEIKSEDGVLWLMKIEVINLSKKSFYSYIVRNSIVLFDQDDFQFEMNQNDHLYDSKFGINTGLNRFQSWTGDPLLQPKIMAHGALACFLPDNDLDNYYISVKKKFM